MAWRPTERSVHGGVDQIPLPIDGGSLWLCGKHLVGPDPEAALHDTGATTVVCLSERHELEDRYPAYVRWLETQTGTRSQTQTEALTETRLANGSDAAAGGRRTARALWHPMPDLGAPHIDDAVALLDDLAARLRAGDGLLIHCGAGIGRAGTVAAGLLIELGLDVATAVRQVAAHRPMAGPEAGAQRELLAELAASRGIRRPGSR